jgi:hypothetical protein
LKEVYYKLGKYDDAKRIMSELSGLWEITNKTF